MGLSAPHEEKDAGGGSDKDAAVPLDAGPAHVRVNIGGSPTRPSPVHVTSAPAGIDCPATSCDATFAPGTQVTLTATVDATTLTYTGFHGGGCNTDGVTPCVFTPAGDVEVLARAFDDNNKMFVSSTVQHPGGFDSVDNADKLCQQLADDAGVPGGFGGFHAYLSTTSDTAIARVLTAFPGGTDPSGYVRVDGSIVTFDALNDLQKGHFVAPVRLDERGHDVGDDAIVVTDTDGTGAPGESNHCSDWASESGSALVLAGEAAGGTGRWTASTTVGCNADSHIYCVGGVAAHAFAIAMTNEPTMWVSSTAVAGDAGLAAMDTICSNEAAARGFTLPSNTALVSPGGGKPVAERFKDLGITGVVHRPDGFDIAQSTTDLLAFKPFASVPNVDSLNNYVDANLWVGGGGFDVFATDCNGWKSQAGNGTGRPAATTRDHSLSVSMACSEQHKFWCLNYLAFEAIK